MRINFSKLKQALKSTVKFIQVATPHVVDAVSVAEAVNSTQRYKHKDKVGTVLSGAALAASAVNRVVNAKDYK